MPWPLIIGAVASVAGGALAARGADDAADAQRDAANSSAAVANRALDLQVSLARPQLEVGTSALGALSSIFGLAQPTPIDFDGLGSGGGTLDFSQGPTSSVAGDDYIIQGFQQYRGRNPTPFELQYYRGDRSENSRNRLNPLVPLQETSDALNGGGSGGGRRERADEFYNDVIAPGPLEATGAYYSGQGETPYQGEIVPISERNIPGSDQGIQQPEQAPAGLLGGAAGPDLNALVNNNPLIQFQRQQGEQAIARGAAARGINQSGGTLRDLTQFNNDVTGAGIQDFVLNPLFELAGFGPRASGQISGAVGTNAVNVGNSIQNAGNARASAFQNQGNIYGNTLSDIGGSIFRQYGQGGG